jgi:hypothetical protein
MALNGGIKKEPQPLVEFTASIDYYFHSDMEGVWCPNISSNGKEATVNRALDDSTYPGQMLVHSVFGKINYGGLKHISLYLGLVLPSGG